MSSPIPTLTPQLFPYVFIAFVMVGANLYFLVLLFPRKGGTPNLSTIILIFGLLFMSAGLWLALIYSITTPGDTSSIVVFIAGNSMMAVFGAWMIGVMLRAEEKYPTPGGWFWPGLLALLFVGNEIMMGVVFVIAQAGTAPYAAADGSGLVRLLTGAVVSVWFFWAMLANMVVLLLWLPIPGPERRLLLGFAASSAAGPWVLSDPLAAAVAMMAVMGLTFGVLYYELSSGTARSERFLRISAAVVTALAAMSISALAAFLDGGTLWASASFALTSVLVMGTEVILLARWAFRTAPSPLPLPGGASTGPLEPGTSPGSTPDPAP